MDFDLQWLLLGLPVVFALGWIAARMDLRQMRRDQRETPKAYFKGLNLLLNEQHDKAVDAFIEAVQLDPDTSDLHFALGNLFRRRGEYERAVRVHQHLLQRADLPQAERERAQRGLAHDYMKAGLFDRAEAAWQALEGTSYDTEARLALLSLHERSRDWRAAVDDATRLERSGTGSYASRIAHYWCELAQEADARGDAAEAEASLQRARDVSPQSPRVMVVAGERALAAGRPQEALDAWRQLAAAQPAMFGLVATRFAEAAKASGQVPAARVELETLYRRAPALDLLHAVNLLDDDAAARRRRLVAHLAEHPSLSAARDVLHEQPDATAAGTEIAAIEQAVARAAAPLQRYRCAACGFEAHHYFWQCPGCLSWDSYPPLRLEDQ